MSGSRGKLCDGRGFTLIELLVVILIIGMLMALLSSALLKARENAKDKMYKVDCETLKTAIWNYRHEYGRWPIPPSTGTVSIISSNNFYIMDRLISKDTDKNERQIQFINLGEYYTTVRGKRKAMATVWNPETSDNKWPVVDPWNRAYWIRIDMEKDKVDVEKREVATNLWL